MAGPVGEALIMTAIGLAVAVPAVLGYNILLRRNKGVQEMVSHFTHELHAYLISGAKMGLGMDKGPGRRSPSPLLQRLARKTPMAITVGGGDEGEAMSDINVTPLVDVMLVLLIIFIITIRVIIQQVPVELPKATNLPTQTKPENITIAIDKAGRHLLEYPAAVGPGGAQAEAARHRARRAAAGSAHSRRCQRSVPIRGPGTRGHAADRHTQSGVHHHTRSFRSRNVGENRDGHECRRGGEGQSYSDINMTPLIDVMLVLLIIFIITIPSHDACGEDRQSAAAAAEFRRRRRRPK